MACVVVVYGKGVEHREFDGEYIWGCVSSEFKCEIEPELECVE